MNLYFVKTVDEPRSMSMTDFVCLAKSKDQAEESVMRRTKRNVVKEKTRLVPNGHYIVGETFINSES